MYRPNYMPFAFLAMTAFALAASSSTVWLPRELFVGRDPIPTGKSSRSNASFRRNAAKKKRQKCARSTRKK